VHPKKIPIKSKVVMAKEVQIKEVMTTIRVPLEKRRVFYISTCAPTPTLLLEIFGVQKDKNNYIL
jgi:hypothetical protein